jgi:thiol-disulfide isomerase/thioredoxin
MIKVIMFTSTTCLPCEKMKPVLSSVCDELSVPLDFIWKESDKENSFNRYNILSVPTFLIMKKQDDQYLPINSYIGTRSRAELVNLLTRHKEM